MSTITLSNSRLSNVALLAIEREVRCHYALCTIHYAHQGIEKCHLGAKSSVFWDCINTDIEKKIERCSHCQIHQASAMNEPLIPHDLPPRAWHILSSDVFYWEQKQYLLVADLFSKFPIMRKLESLSSRATISDRKPTSSVDG